MWVTKTTLTPLVEQRAHDLPRDLGALALVGRGERLVAEQDAAVGSIVVGDLAHPGEFLVELPALHRRVLFALVVREHAVADVGAERLARATNMPLCIISWARPTLRRNVDLPPWLAPVIITSDLPSASTSLPTTRCRRGECEAHVVEPAGRKRALVPGDRGRERRRLALLSEPLVQVQAAEVEGELGPEHDEEAVDVIGRLAECVGDEVDAPVFERRRVR